MRAAHITDLHVEAPPRVGQLFSKRALGALNLYVLGRHAHFSRRTVDALVQAVVEAAPDIVLCTGDLTATALPEEFACAVELLRPLTSRFPFVVLPGNHDVYTRGSVGRLSSYFGEWSNDGQYPFSRVVHGVWFVAIDVSRPDWLSRGGAPVTQLEALDALLGAGVEPVVLLLHYPLRNRHGGRYGPANRAMTNAAALEAVLGRHPRVVAVLHGHEHHGYRTQVPSAARGDGIVSLNPGAGGYAFLPARRRTAHFNLYDIDAAGGIDVRRLAFDGARFLPEEGGAYASGG